MPAARRRGPGAMGRLHSGSCVAATAGSANLSVEHCDEVSSVDMVKGTWLAGLVLALVSFGGCADEDAVRPSQTPSTQAAVVPAPAPEGTEEDPLAGLPVTSLRDTLARWPALDDGALVVVDLDSGQVESFEDAETETLEGVTFTADGSLVYVDSPSSLVVIGNDGQRRPIPLDDQIDDIGNVEVIGERIIVRPSIRAADNDRLVALDADGSSLCSGPAEPFAGRVEGGWAWFDQLSSRLDPATCTAEPGLDFGDDPPDGGRIVAAFRVDGGSAFVADDTSVSRFDVESRRLEATSDQPLPLITDLVVRDDDVWVVNEAELVVLDASTLEVERRGALGTCEGTASFVEAAGDVYVLDDCAATLTLLDPLSGEPADAWGLPSDEMSDHMIRLVVAGENIWMIDSEQSAEPFVFNHAARRFERLPDAARAEVGASAWQIAVDPAR